MSHCFRDFVVIYNSLPMHAALVLAVLHVRALFEKMRARVDLQIARYYTVLQYSRMSQPPWSNFRGGDGAPGAPWFLRLCTRSFHSIHASTSSSKRDPVSAALQIATRLGGPPVTALHTERGGGGSPYSIRECDRRTSTFVKDEMPSCYKKYTSIKEGQHMYTGAYHVKLVLSCAALHPHAATHSNTRKPTHPYLLQGHSSKHVSIILDSAARFELGGTCFPPTYPPTCTCMYLVGDSPCTQPYALNH